LELAKQRTTVLFSTHILSDVERICDTVGVLDKGKLVLYGKLEALKEAHRRDTVEIEASGGGGGSAGAGGEGTGRGEGYLALLDGLRSLPFVEQVVVVSGSGDEAEPRPGGGGEAEPRPGGGGTSKGGSDSPAKGGLEGGFEGGLEGGGAGLDGRREGGLDGRFLVDVNGLAQNGPRLLAFLASQPLDILRYEVKEPTLESLYLEVVK
jgi:ABC-type multidrug transport system ATPase subunit